jgi:hypothetical protein
MLLYNIAMSITNRTRVKKITSGSSRDHYLAIATTFLVTAALIGGMVGCVDGGGGDYNPPPPENLEIRTWYDLDAVRDNLAGNHTLMNDLDSTTAGYDELAGPTANAGKGWEAIGFVIPECKCTRGQFTGTFDGQGYDICDLYINRPDESDVGLFGMTTQDAVIQNTGVVNATVTGDVAVGCLVGGSYGTVSNCYSNGNVIGNVAVGGLVGTNGYGTVSDSYSTGRVTGDEYIGGLVGWHADIVRNSYSTCNVTGSSSVGGLVGYNYGNDGTVSNSYSTGNVTGEERVGGLVGWTHYSTVSNSFWDTETSGQATSDGGTGKTTGEMQDITTFSEVGWNITAVALNETNPAYIWNIVNNVTFPFLGWQS